MLSARQANGDEQKSAGNTPTTTNGGNLRQLNGNAASGRASLDSHNEPKSKQQSAIQNGKPAAGNEHDDANNKDSLTKAPDGAYGQYLPVVSGGTLGLPVDGRNEHNQSETRTTTSAHNLNDDIQRPLLIDSLDSSASDRADSNRERGRQLQCNQKQQQPDESSDEESAPNERTKFVDRKSEATDQKWKFGWLATANRDNQKAPLTNVDRKKRAQLAQQESITERGAPISALSRQAELEYEAKTDAQAARTSIQNNKKTNKSQSADPDDDHHNACSIMFQIVRARKCLTIPLLILVIYIAAIYCLPFIEFEPKIPSLLPAIPFDFQEGPLRPSSASAFKFEHMFKDQIHGPESLALDSMGNLYMAIEGGFVLYAYLNKSSPLKRAYFDQADEFERQKHHDTIPELVKIAELNGLRQVLSPRLRGASRAGDWEPVTWKRECQLDEKVYGNQLFTIDNLRGFRSNVRISRCSKPLGIRLNADETQLYVIDTLAGLFRIDLRAPNNKQRKAYKAHGTHLQVFKLIDFKANNGYQVLPAVQLEDEAEQQVVRSATNTILSATRLMNVSLKALDDLAIDRTPDGNHDLIYMTVASQMWPATSYIYDALEGRPSGLVLRYNTANNQLVVLEPDRVALVRISAIRTDIDFEQLRENHTLFAGRSHQPSFLLGAPRMDENDIFDERPLNFPNGLELTDDRQALLIADTTNKRIVRHHIRGPRRGTSDLWAWTPMFPDNIRRGQDRFQETYWVVGCGKAHSASTDSWIMSHRDPFEILRTWPQLRKFLMKNVYFIGYLVEFVGENVFRSNKIQDTGYALRTGSSLCSSGCSGMMIIQYNKHGDVIRSIHSREFPNDLYYYSQVNELTDYQTQEHLLYLGSPSYSYLTKLTLPTESRVDLASSQHQASFSLLLGNNNNFDDNINQINNDYRR